MNKKLGLILLFPCVVFANENRSINVSSTDKRDIIYTKITTEKDIPENYICKKISDNLNKCQYVNKNLSSVIIPNSKPVKPIENNIKNNDVSVKKIIVFKYKDKDGNLRYNTKIPKDDHGNKMPILEVRNMYKYIQSDGQILYKFIYQK